MEMSLNLVKRAIKYFLISFIFVSIISIMFFLIGVSLEFILIYYFLNFICVLLICIYEAILIKW